MGNRIFLLKNELQLEAMDESAYESEDHFQELLANYPDLLDGEQINIEDPRRWLLVSREMSVPGELDGSGRWSLDHLFLDQQGIPTLVEVKRSSDTRIRREVIGQILDYAANAVVYWPIEKIQAEYERRCETDGQNSDEQLAKLLQEKDNIENFWQQVKTNLQAGRIRMLIVADVIPPELRRIVEFLNGQMNPAEILAISIRQFLDPQGKIKILVPSVLGQTEVARQKKSAGHTGSIVWDEEEFMAKLNPDCKVTAQRLLDWVKSKKGISLEWGKGPEDGSFSPAVKINKKLLKLFHVRTKGKFEVPLDKLRANDISNKFLSSLIGKLSFLGEKKMGDRAPQFDMNLLRDEAHLGQFLKAFDWLLDEIAKSISVPDNTGTTSS